MSTLHWVVLMVATAQSHAAGMGSGSAMVGWCRPGQTCWPSPADIIKLGLSLDGTVVTRDAPSFDDLCHVKNLRFNATRPGMVVEAKSQGDIKRTLAFAQNHTMRLVVMSTGHDYDGRSTAPDSLMLSMKNLLSMTSHTIDLPGEPPATVMKVETGNTFTRIYAYADTLRGSVGERLVVVGGSDGGVGIGGWTMGGGHSALSRMYGLGVDNVVSFDVVLANGDVVVANGTSNSDLFWALRGGGGGTFGVVANMTIRLRPDPGQLTVFTQLCAKWSTKDVPDIGIQATTALQQVIANAPDQMSGYPQFLNPDRLSGIGMAWALLFFGSKENATQHLGPLLGLPSKECPHTFSTVSRYYLYTKTLPVAKDRALYMASSVFDGENLVSKNALVKAATWIFTNNISSAVTGIGLGTGCSVNFGTGGAAGRIDPSTTAVHPRFRTGIAELSCYASWEGTRGYPEVNNAMDKWANDELNPLGDGAAYFNEPQSDRADWQQAFWGSSSRYEKLLAVKLKYDPNAFFACHHCVGWGEPRV